MEAPSSMLLRLHDTDLTVADPQQAVRSFKVVDSAGKEIGHVDDLLIDDTEKKVRFLLVRSGGFLGLGEKKFLIPVDAIARIAPDRVEINRTGEHVAAGPDYNPALANENNLRA